MKEAKFLPWNGQNFKDQTKAAIPSQQIVGLNYALCSKMEKMLDIIEERQPILSSKKLK